MIISDKRKGGEKMADINIDPYEVRKAASTLRNCTSQIKGSYHTFDDIEENIETAWKSSSTRDYLNCLDETETDVRRTVSALDSIAEALERIARAVEQAEADLQNVMSGGGNGAFGGGNGGGGFR